MKSKTLLLLWGHYLHYHNARMRTLLARGAAEGWNVKAVTVSSDPSTDYFHTASAAGGFETVALTERKTGLEDASLCEPITRLLDEASPDVVFTPGYGFPVARTMLAWAHRKRRASVVMFESKAGDRRRFLPIELYKRFVLRHAGCAFCGGSLHAAYAKSLGFGEDRIFTGYSAVDNDYWGTRTAERRGEPSPLKQPYVLSTGRMIPKKGFASLLRAFAAFKRSDARGTSLVLLGDGPERDTLRALAAREGLGDWVRLPGYVDADEACLWLAHASVFVAPSLFEEQWGLVVNEAMAAGVPTLVSDACGCAPDLVEQGRSGFTFPAGDESALAALLTRLSADAPLRESLSQGARSQVARFSLEIFAERALQAAERALLLAGGR